VKIILFIIPIFCLIHIIRDYYQIKYGYKSWFTRFGHFWHKPKYEIHGMIVFATIGLISLYFAFN
jgi:hypothetical protein